MEVLRGSEESVCVNSKGKTFAVGDRHVPLLEKLTLQHFWIVPTKQRVTSRYVTNKT